MVLTPHQLIARLVAIIPQPRRNLTHYHGVFAPAAQGRCDIVLATRHAARGADPRRRTGGSALPRDEIFVTTKLRNLDQGCCVTA